MSGWVILMLILLRLCITLRLEAHLLTGELWALFVSSLIFALLLLHLVSSHWPPPFSWNPSRCAVPQSLCTQCHLCPETSSCRYPFLSACLGSTGPFNRGLLDHSISHCNPDNTPLLRTHYPVLASASFFVMPYHHGSWFSIYLLLCLLIDSRSGK